MEVNIMTIIDLGHEIPSEVNQTITNEDLTEVETEIITIIDEDSIEDLMADIIVEVDQISTIIEIGAGASLEILLEADQVLEIKDSIEVEEILIEDRTITTTDKISVIDQDLIVTVGIIRHQDDQTLVNREVEADLTKYVGSVEKEDIPQENVIFVMTPKETHNTLFLIKMKNQKNTTEKTK